MRLSKLGEFYKKLEMGVFDGLSFAGLVQPVRCELSYCSQHLEAWLAWGLHSAE